MNTPAKPKKRALGRGLSALISSASAVPVTPPQSSTEAFDNSSQPGAVKLSIAATSSENAPAETTVDSSGFTERIRYIPISQIQNNPKQPRQEFSEQEIAELSDSIRKLGILQPIMLRPVEGLDGRYEIVAGERRWRASKHANLRQVPAIIREVSDRELLEIAIVENVQRSNLSPLEEARAYQQLIDEFSMTQREVAESVGKDRTSISNFLRLLKLPLEVQNFLKEDKISMGHAKAILTVREPGVQISLANKVIEEGLSVRALEAIVARVVVLDKNPKKKLRKGGSARDEQFPEVTERIRRKLGTKVNINHHTSGRGKIEIEYFSESELDRLIELICD